MGLLSKLGLGSQKSVLVVDDDDMSLESTAMILERRGFKTYKARGGAEALSQALSLEPRIILLDIHMSGKDGWEVLQALRSTPTTKKIPVVMMTGVDQMSDINKSFQLGANGYMVKPVNSAKLYKQVEDLIGKP